MNITAIVQARMTSTRLPGKTLRPILGRPMLDLLLERLRRAKTLGGLIVATTDGETDDPVEALCARLGIGCFRGSEEDVLDRVLRAACEYHVDVLVEITGDCPLIDPDVVDDVVTDYLRGGADYVSNCLERTFPRGLDTQVFSRQTLEDVARRTDDPVDHEHVSLFIYQHPELYLLRNVRSKLKLRVDDLRWTVDTSEDFELVRRVYESLYPTQPAFSWLDVLALFERDPRLGEINRHVRQKAVR